MIFVLSLIYARFVVSVSMILLVVLAIVKVRKESNFNLSSFFKDIPYSGLLLVFAIILLSGINSEDKSEWIDQIRLKLPFLLLPISFYVLKSIDKETHRWIHLGLIGVVVISAFQVLGSFLFDYEAISQSINRGKSIPTPLDHIHYSIILAYATVSSFVLGILDKNKLWKRLLFLAGLFLFGFSHFLSVRSGLVLCYAGIATTLVWYVVKNKKYIVGFSVAALLAILPFVAYHTVDPFHKKVQYMMWDIEQYQKGKGNNYSDSERLMSYEIAIDLIGDAPMLGHGIGDLRPLTTKKHKEKYGTKEKYIYPHNQYLYIGTAVGILGAIVFFFGLLCPLIFTEQRNIFLVLIYVMLLLSFLVENTIQRAVITAFFLFFILLNLSLKTENDVSNITPQ